MNEFMISEQELCDLIEDLIDWGALEFCPQASGEVLIPYVMNDAAEHYVRLTECRMHGALDHLPNYAWEDPAEEILEITDVELVQNEGLKGVILRQASGNVVTIWYQEAWRVANCFQYHLIGHNWRKKAGEEYMRRMVNLLCVLHDKKMYLGEAYCNELECWLADLAECSPVLFFSPIDEDIRNWYPETEAGVEAVLRLAKLAADTGLVAEMEDYQSLFLSGKCRPKHQQRMVKLLKDSAHMTFWRSLEKYLQLASLYWPARDYGAEINQEIAQKREKIVEEYQAKGFQGEYPHFYGLQESGNVGEEVLFLEEHPFTVLESEDYQWKVFRIELCPQGALSLKKIEKQ